MLKWTVVMTLLCMANRLLSQPVFTYKDKSFIYTLKRDSADYNCTVKSILVTALQNGKMIQLIKPEVNSISCSIPANQLFILEDVNFDGYTDIRLLQFLPAGPNLPYYFWIFDPSLNKFQRDTTLESITSPAFDHNKKIISSQWRDGCCTHGSSTYKYVNKQPMLIEESETKPDGMDDTKQITTTKKLVNGKLKLVNRTISKAVKNKD